MSYPTEGIKPLPEAIGYQITFTFKIIHFLLKMECWLPNSSSKYIHIKTHFIISLLSDLQIIPRTKIVTVGTGKMTQHSRALAALTSHVLFPTTTWWLTTI